jgi:hypothetical protein
MKRALFSLAALVALFASLNAQVITLGTGTVVNTTTGYPAPYGNFYWGSRHQFLITAAEFTAAGAVPGSIVSLGLDVVSYTGQPLATFDIWMGHTTQTAMVNWETGLSWVYSTTNYIPTPGWNTHTFCSPFIWNGVSNVVVQTCHQNLSYTTNAIFNQTAGTVNLCKYYRADAGGVCANTAQTGVSVNRPNMRLTYGVPTPVDYQTNSVGSTLTMGTAGTTGCTAPIFTQHTYVCGATTVGSTGSIGFSSTALGFPWDVVISSANVVPLSAGGLAIPAGIINLNLAAPFGFVNGFFGSNLPTFTFPGVTSATLAWPYNISTQVDNTLQAMAINPTAPGGASLSQAVEYHNVMHVNGVATVAGPTLDDQGVTVSLTTPQVCWPSVTMFGTVYTQMQIISNGRVMFQPTINTDFSPTVAEAQLSTVGPFVGYWTDFNPALAVGSSITASQPAPGLLRVDYVNVPYDSDPTPLNSFGIQFDTTTGQVQLDGLTGIATNPQTVLTAASDSVYMGLSKGAGATDGGLTTFSSGGSGTAVSATAMWYDWYGAIAGGQGKVNSLMAGTLNAIVWTPSGTVAPNYNWMGF